LALPNEGIRNVTKVHRRWSESEDKVLVTSLAAKIDVQNIADFLDRDVNEVMERITHLNGSGEKTSSEVSG
jgi:hypothetical protein